MDTITTTFNNVETSYKLVNGTAYHLSTPQAVIDILENSRINKKRLKLYLGDVKTGRDWGEEHDTFGHVGRSTGSIKIPLLISKSNSSGGGALLDDCIVKIKESKGKKVLYEIANYQPLKLSIELGINSTYELWVNDTLYSKHKTLLSATLLKNKLS